MINLLYEILHERGLSADKAVLVGGLAISMYTELEISKDVDFALMTEEYAKISKPDIWGIKTVIYEWGSVDYLNPDIYVSEGHKGNEFITYVKQHRSFKKDGLYVANPEVVFYTRLVVPQWRGFIPKNIRDLGFGLIREKDKIYAGVKAIADVFGTRSIINERIKELDEHVQSYFSVPP